jgi:2-oxoglutarate ferredoxin oxidoreductase subunit gamma
MPKCRLIFSGSGGQGVITASIILAEAAVIHEGLNAIQTQSYGPEARGGATRADVIIDEDNINFPKVTQPNVVVSLTQTAYDKFSWIIRPGGLLIIDSRYVKTQRKVDARQISLGMYDAVMEKIGKSVVFNTCVLGALIGLTGLVKPESIMKILETRIPRDYLEINRKALDTGLTLTESFR